MMEKMLILFFRAISLFSILFLTGCGQWYWVSNSRPLSNLDSDWLDCQYVAYKEFPPNVYKTVAPNYGAIFYNSMQSSSTKTNCYQYENSLQCQANHQAASYLPQEVVVSRDANTQAREQTAMKCMYEKGWKLEYRDVWS